MGAKKLWAVLVAVGLLLAGCASTTVEAQEPASSGYQPIEVDEVSAEVGVGSPIPVMVNITGSLPGNCAQLDLVTMEQDGMTFNFELSTVAANLTDCPPDSLPFRLQLPINVIGLPGGSYEVSANGVHGAFDLENNISGSVLAGELAVTKDDIQVSQVAIEVGVGSPIPVHAVVDLNLPNSCSQLGEIRLHRQEQAFTIQLISYTMEREGCQADSIPFRAEIPLNMVNLEAGAYSVNVNGFETSLQWPPKASEPSQDRPETAMAYVGVDGNLWAGLLGTGDYQQITTDATSMTGGLASDYVVNYYNPAFSSDGRFLAARRDEGRSVVGGFDYTFSLMVYDLETGEAIKVSDEMPAGLDWKPGTHQLAYALPFSEEYFSSRGQVDVSKARSLMLFDADIRSSSELVKPEGGYAIYSPSWSPDGRYLAFEEVWNYEGSGYFSLYDFETSTYHSWAEAIGQFAWSPSSDSVAYDRMTYTATGDERIYLHTLSADSEKLITEEIGGGYTFHPVFSPAGTKIAYFVHKGEDLDSQVFEVYIQDLAGGEPTIIGDFSQVHSLAWSADGQHLILDVGLGEAPEILALSVSDGSLTSLAEGSFPTLAASRP